MTAVNQFVVTPSAALDPYRGNGRRALFFARFVTFFPRKAVNLQPKRRTAGSTTPPRHAARPHTEAQGGRTGGDPFIALSMKNPYFTRHAARLLAVAGVVAAALLLPHEARAAQGARSEFYQKYMSRSSEELIRLGKDYRFRQNKPDSALLFFTIVAGRYTPDMSRGEKRQVVEALNMNYFIYSLTFLNYPKAYDNLLRAYTISRELGETSPRTYFNLGSMYQLAAAQGRRADLYVKALDCYRKAVRKAVGERDQATADMAFTNMTSLSDVVGLFDSTRAEWQAYRRARPAKPTLRYRYNVILYEGTRLKLAGQYERAAKEYARLLDVAPDTRENCRFRALAYMERAEVMRILRRYDKGLALVGEAERVYRKYKVGDGMQSVYQTRAIFYQDMGRTEDYDRAMYQFYQINDSLKANSLPSNVANMGLNEKVMELNAEMDGMKEKQAEHRMWLVVAVVTVVFAVIILLVVVRENRELRRRNLALYQRTLDELRDDDLAASRRKAATEREEGAAAQEKYVHSTLSETDKDRIARMVRQVMDRTELIAQPDFTIERLAQTIHTGQKYVSQVVNETFGCNFATLLGRHRVREACRRFNDPDHYGSYTIESIARDLGFKSRSNFATTFRKHTGLNPSEYLRLAREKHAAG